VSSNQTHVTQLPILEIRYVLVLDHRHRFVEGQIPRFESGRCFLVWHTENEQALVDELADHSQSELLRPGSRARASVIVELKS